MKSLDSANHTSQYSHPTYTVEGHLAIDAARDETYLDPTPSTIITQYPEETTFPLQYWLPTPLTIDTHAAAEYTQEVQRCLTQPSYDCFFTLLENTLQGDTVSMLEAIHTALAVGWKESDVQEGMSLIASKLQIIAAGERKGHLAVQLGAEVKDRLQQLAWECTVSPSMVAGDISDYQSKREGYETEAGSLVDKFVKIGKVKNQGKQNTRRSREGSSWSWGWF